MYQKNDGLFVRKSNFDYSHAIHLQNIVCFLQQALFFTDHKYVDRQTIEEKGHTKIGVQCAFKTRNCKIGQEMTIKCHVFVYPSICNNHIN